MNTTHALSILLIDDEENDSLLFRLAVESLGQGHHLSIFNNVEEAIQHLQELDAHHRPLPHLVLVDLRMHGMNGHYLLKWLRDHPRLHALPAVVLSAADSRREVQEAFRLGARSYLTKPSTYDDLVEMVRTLVESWRSGQSRPNGTENGKILPGTHSAETWPATNFLTSPEHRPQL